MDRNELNALVAEDMNDIFGLDDADEVMDARGGSRRPRRRRRRRYAPCNCPQCLMDDDDAGDDFDEYDFDDVTVEGEHEDDFDDDDDEDLALDGWDDAFEEDDEDDEAMDARRRPQRRRRRRYAPCSCPQCLMEDDEADDDDDNECACKDREDDLEDDDYDDLDEDDFDDDDEDDDLALDGWDDAFEDDDEDDNDEAMDAPRRPRRRRRRRYAPCNCPQCLMDDAFEDDDEDDEMDDDDILDDAEDEEFDDDLDDVDEDDFDARRGSRRRRRYAPCSCPQCLMEDDEAEDFEADCADDDEEDDALDDEDDDEEDDDLDDDDLEDADGWGEDFETIGEDDFDIDDADDLDQEDRHLDFATDDSEAVDDEEAFEDGGFEYFDDVEMDDDQDAREPVWKGFFSDTDKNRIREALRIAEKQAKRAKCVFDRIAKQRGGLLKRAKRRRAAYFKMPFVHMFFGHKAVTQGEIRRMHRRVKRIERSLRKRRIRFVKAFENTGRCKKGSSAYVRAAGGIRKFYICNKFLLKTPATMARTIIHELVHEIGFCHYSTSGKVRCTRAGAKSASDCISLARRHPRRARKNPQNYVHLFDRLSKSARTGC